MTKLSFNNVYSGQYNYLVGSNITNFFALGDFLEKSDFYLIGYHKKEGKISLLGSLFNSDGNKLCTFNDNFSLESLGDDPITFKEIEDKEIEIVDFEDKRYLYAHSVLKAVQTNQGLLKTNITEVIGEFYNKKGELVVIGTPEGLELKMTKGVFGVTKFGSMGMVIGCSQKEMDFIREFVKNQLSKD